MVSCKCDVYFTLIYLKKNGFYSKTEIPLVVRTKILKYRIYRKFIATSQNQSTYVNNLKFPYRIEYHVYQFIIT